MTSRHSGTRQGRFLPYRYERTGLAFELLDCTLDGHEEGVSLDRERRQVALEADDFRAMAVRFRIRVPEGLPARVVPEPERAAPPLALWLALRCPQTRLRRSVSVGQGAVRAGEHDGRIVLHREDCRGPVELVPFLTRAEPAPRVVGYAHERGARLASARPWSLKTDPEPPPPGRFLDIRYCVFADDRVLAHCRDALYRLEADQERPVLWINQSHQQIAALLDDRGTRGQKARARDVFYDQIAYAVWTQLFLRAASRAGPDQEALYDWEHAVLREVLPEMYPSARGHHARLAALRKTLAYGDGAVLMEQLDLALQRKNEIAAHMTKLAAEIFERRGG